MIKAIKHTCNGSNTCDVPNHKQHYKIEICHYKNLPCTNYCIQIVKVI